MNTSTRRGITWTAVLAASTLALAACGGGDDGDGADGGGGTEIAAVIKGLDNPFFQQMESGIDGGASAGDVAVEVQAAQDIADTTGQLDRLESLASQDQYGCYIVNPIDGTNLIQGIARASAEDKIVVNIDSPVEAEAADESGADIATYIGTDNVDAGTTAGEHMSELVPDGGQVALVGGIAGDVTSGARLEGFEAGIADNLEVVQTVAANWSRDEALTQATTVLRANPDLQGFFVANDDMALGVARAVSNAGLGDQVRIIAVDGVEDGLNAVKNGDIDATVAQYPYAIGEMGVNACRAALAGEDIPEDVTAPVALVTPDNVDDALAAAPEPFEPYDDPFAELVE